MSFLLASEFRDVAKLFNRRTDRETQYYKNKERKKVFPQDLVEPSKAVGRKAIDLRIVDDPFFDVVAPYHIGYNRFTMKKWLLNNCKDYLPVSIANLEDKILAELQIEIDVLAVDYMQAFEEESKSCRSSLSPLPLC